MTSIIDEGDFEAERWYRVLQEERVSVWYTAPTAIRMMMKLGAEVAHEYQFANLRFLASVGEPLNPEAVIWSREAFGVPFHDNWWQTETGGIMIANYAAMDIRPGSMGKPLPGIEAAIVREVNGHIVPIEDPNVQGELALRTPWPSMFRGYLHEEACYQKCFADGYLSKCHSYLSPAECETRWLAQQNFALQDAIRVCPPLGALRPSQATHAPARG